MQAGNKFFDDMGKLMTNAMGVAQGAKTEMETAMKSFIDRWMADRDFVTATSSTPCAPWRKRLAKRISRWKRVLQRLRARKRAERVRDLDSRGWSAPIG